MKNRINAFIFLSIIMLIKPNEIFGQKDSIHQQVSIGISLIEDFTPLFLNLEYKSFFKKKLFYSLSAEGYYTSNSSNQYEYDHLSYEVAASASIGIYYKFLKKCRFNMAAQIAGFYSNQKGTSNPLWLDEYDYNRKRAGVFLGPEFIIEIRAFRVKLNEISIFIKTHVGYGIMHETFYINKVYPRDTNENYNEWYGASIIGINYRF